MAPRLHLVSFTVPAPPNYGGVIDVYYKLKALHEAGCEVILHCFTYKDRQPQKYLEEFTHQIYYYQRKPVSASYLSSRPYIISSRAVNQLHHRLAALEYPVLFEGVHTTAFLSNPLLQNRQMLVRTHNIEWQYYRELARSTQELHLKIHYQIEWNRLRRYEHKELAPADHILAISQPDMEYFQGLYGNKVIHVPAFHRFDDLVVSPGLGDFVLYHADLSVPENIRAVYMLAEKAWSQVPFRVVVAGRNPHQGIREVLGKYPNIELRANVSSEQMEQLMREAQVHVVHAFQTAGFKIKLVHAAFTARHCLVNRELAASSGLGEILETYGSSEEMIKKMTTLMQTPVEHADIENRRSRLYPGFDNRTNARRIVELLG